MAILKREYEFMGHSFEGPDEARSIMNLKIIFNKKIVARDPDHGL